LKAQYTSLEYVGSFPLQYPKLKQRKDFQILTYIIYKFTLEKAWKVTFIVTESSFYMRWKSIPITMLGIHQSPVRRASCKIKKL